MLETGYPHSRKRKAIKGQNRDAPKLLAGYNHGGTLMAYSKIEYLPYETLTINSVIFDIFTINILIYNKHTHSRRLRRTKRY